MARRQRSVGTDYARHTIEDRPEEIDNTIEFIDADGDSVDVGSSNPLPVSSTLAERQESTETNQLLKLMIDEQKKTNLYLAEMIGDTFDETR